MVSTSRLLYGLLYNSVVRWRWEREGVKDGCYNLLWQQQHVRGRTAQLSDISSGATCVADLDSGALALPKEASGNSRERGIYSENWRIVFVSVVLLRSVLL